MPLGEGTRLVRYEVRALLGAGAMGDVYLGQDTRLDRRVGIKILPRAVRGKCRPNAPVCSGSKVCLGANHPNIITLYEVGETNETNFIAYGVHRGYIAAVYVGFGDSGQAFAWLEKDFHETERRILPQASAAVVTDEVAGFIVCQPKHNKLLASGNRSDRVNARELAQLLRGGLLRPR
jgi:serine/threonine protein kinase